MNIDWNRVQNRYDELSKELVDSSLDSQKRSELQRQHGRLSQLLTKQKEIVDAQRAIDDVVAQKEGEKDAQMQALFQEEQDRLEKELRNKREDLDLLLYPSDDHDDRSVYLEIRAGTGGAEAALFAADLLRMYTNYALQKGWRPTVETSSTTDLGGFREVILHIQGKNVFGHLKMESGVHRVQRVPSTETAGRVHTSTATVAVLPEAKEVDVSINPSDLRIDVFRSGGAGGQHVNTTDSAVRITHIPTGVVVSCQDERSQHKNKAKALKILQSRILAARVEAHEAEQSKQRKELVGMGMRAEKVRTYNFPQNRVTDHQVNVTLKKLDIVMAGNLDEIIEPLMIYVRDSRKKESFLTTIGL